MYQKEDIKEETMKHFTIFKVLYKFDSELASILKVRVEKYEKQYNCKFSQLFFLSNTEDEKIADYKSATVLAIFL